jgi:hypothetical protein
MTDRFPQGVCCHEAGHAVVAFSLGIRVVAVSVIFTEDKGWHGKTVTEGTPDHWKEQIVLRPGRPPRRSLTAPLTQRRRFTTCWR